MSWWDGTDAFESVHGKTQYRNCWYAMPSISFMNCELLSGALTDNIVRACQHSSGNVKGNWHVSTATFSLFLLLFFFFVPRIDMMEEARTWNWSQGSNSIVFRRPRKLHFLHISKEFPHLPAAQSHGSSYGLQWQWKDRVCCCVNRGNDPLTLCVCVHRWLYCPIWMFTV